MKEQKIELARLERQPELSAAAREDAATIHEHIALIYQVLGEVYPFAARLWNGLASREYDKAAGHQITLFRSTTEPVAIGEVAA